jgi:hypothetical protein
VNCVLELQGCLSFVCLSNHSMPPFGLRLDDGSVAHEMSLANPGRSRGAVPDNPFYHGLGLQYFFEAAFVLPTLLQRAHRARRVHSQHDFDLLSVALAQYPLFLGSLYNYL